MTQKQSFEELFSILGVDIHSDNSHIHEKKKDIQKNVEKILKLIEEGNEAKSEAVSLIKDFHKGYEDLYDQYGQLIEGLKKEGNVSLSNQVKEDEAIIFHLTINIKELIKLLEAKEEEVRSLNSQFEEGGQKLVMKLTDLQIEQSELLAEYNQLKHELDTERRDASDIKQKLEAAKGENLKNIGELNEANSTVKKLENKLKQLRDENSILNQSKIKLEEAEKIADSCKAEIQQLRDANTKLQVDLGAAIQKQETAISHLDDLKKENMEVREGKNMSASELSSADTKIRNLEGELEQMRKEASTLQQSEKDLYRKNSDLESRLKATQEKLDENTMHANKLQKELHFQSTQKSEVEEEVKKLEQRCLEYKLLMKNLEETLASKIVAQETRLSHLKCCIGELGMNYKQQKDVLKEIFVKIQTLKLEKDFKDHAEKLKLETVVFSSENEQLSSENRNLNLILGTAKEEKGSLKSEIMTPAIGLREDESTINIPSIDSKHLKEQTKAEDKAYSLDSQKRTK
uniref:Uncharacterized protein n=1 Tax=Ananas comosus var. bracteatus TaxID=296719 RepID=A0A6V7PTG3_ANACO|nr:unnamed protein product [Ananas comosus var. bracteatus]